MKCPHCGNKVSVFSKAMNRIGKVKKCPHCGNDVKLRLNFSRFAGVFFSVAIGATLVGFGGAIGLGCAGFLSTLVALDLKVAE